MVPIITSRAYSVGPILESHDPNDPVGVGSRIISGGRSSNKSVRKYSNCATEAKQCQDRIICLEQALGLMQNELTRLPKAEQQYSSSDADSWTSQEPKKKKIHYDKISVWPSAMFEDWVQKWKDQATVQASPPPPPKPLPRTASLHDKLFRARSMAPATVSTNQNTELKRSKTTIGGVWYDRATSAPPAAPPPIFRRYRQKTQYHLIWCIFSF